MRFIRDIINDTRAETESEQDASERAPLMLEDPTFPAPDVSQSLVSAPVETAMAGGFDYFDEDDEDEELEAMMRSLAEEEEAELRIDADAGKSEQIDPFDRLQAETLPSSGGKPPASPLRNVRKSPNARLLAPIPEPEGAAELEENLAVDALTPLADAAAEERPEAPAPAVGRAGGKSGRVKTRLLGFSAGAIERKDPFDKSASLDPQFPVGWLVVTSDKGRGAAFALYDGVSKIGRGKDQTVSLDFGDNSISRDNHLSIAFDAEQNKFFVGHGGKSNLVRLNNKPLLSTEELRSKDMIRLGETTLRFIALCEEDFGWETPPKEMVRHG